VEVHTLFEDPPADRKNVRHSPQRVKVDVDEREPNTSDTYHIQEVIIAAGLPDGFDPPITIRRVNLIATKNPTWRANVKANGKTIKSFLVEKVSESEYLFTPAIDAPQKVKAWK
jgi:hypothetical protein